MTSYAGRPMLLAVLLSLWMLPGPTRAATAAAASHDLLVLRAGNGASGTFLTLTHGVAR